MVGEEKKVKYVSVIPKAAGPDTKFQTFNEEKGKYDFHADFKLIRSIDELREYAKKCVDNRIAVDTETTGLSYDTDFIVGFSVSLSDYDGIYVPIRHQTRTTVKEKVAKVDENGEPVLTKTGKKSMHTIERHTDRDWAGNLPAKEALDILFYDIMCKAKMNLLHNSGFDLNMLRKEGYDVIKARTFDTMVLSYIYDPEARMNGLKPLADWVLGRKMTHFDEVTGGDNLFRFTNPEESYEYACSDSACTFGLYKALYKPVLELLKKAPEHMIINGKPYNIMVEDNNLIRAFVDYYDHCELKIDKNVALAYKDLIDKQTAETVEKIYSYFGKGVFSLSTGSKEFKTTMADYNFETGARTKKGAVSYGKEGIKAMQRALNGFKNNIYPLITKIFFIDSKLLFAGKDAGSDNTVRNAAYELAKFIFNYGRPYFKIGKLGESSTALALRDLNNKKLNKEEFVNILNAMYEKEREKLNILQLIQNYSSLQKALNSYVSKLTETDSCRMKYRLTGTKSSRLSSGNGSKNSKAKNTYFSDLSAQTLSKPKACWYEGRPATPEEMETSVLGWVFTPVSNEYYQKYSHEKVIVEGFKQEANIRSCIVAPEGRYIISQDYNSEELVAIAAISGDSVMRNGFLKGLDPHKVTAIGIWGEENYNVNVRKKAKNVNFLMSYQGGPGTLSENLEISFEEAKDIIDKYQQTYHECVRWKQKETEKMYNNGGLVYTKFGRPRQLQPWLDEARRLKDAGLEKYAERSVTSHHIQGCCGDVCRFDMNKFYKQIYCNPEHRDHVDFISFIHDEINVSVDKEYVEKYAKMVQDIMYFPYLDPELPLKTGIEVGYRLGDLYPFEWSDDTYTKLVPERSYFGND